MLQCTFAGGRTKELMRDLLFSSTNMAAMTSHENILYLRLVFTSDRVGVVRALVTCSENQRSES